MDSRTSPTPKRSHLAGPASARALTIATILASGALAWCLIESSYRRRLPNAGLTVARDALDFGEAWASEQYQWTLPIHNATGSDIHVLDLVPSCCARLIDALPFVVPADGTVDVRVALDLRPQTPQQAALVTRPFATTFIPRIQGRAHTSEQGWRVHGIVHTPFGLPLTTLQFGDRLLGGDARFASVKKLLATASWAAAAVLSASVLADCEYGCKEVPWLAGVLDGQPYCRQFLNNEKNGEVLWTLRGTAGTRVRAFGETVQYREFSDCPPNCALDELPQEPQPGTMPVGRTVYQIQQYICEGGYGGN